jgi:hypothetical protein
MDTDMGESPPLVPAQKLSRNRRIAVVVGVFLSCGEPLPTSSSLFKA